MKIKLQQVIDAIESASDAFTDFYDTETGETVSLPDPIVTGESDEELSELIDNSYGRFLRFPTQYDIHEYSIMEDFAESLPSGAVQRELLIALDGKGAFHRFKNVIRYHNMEQQWYDYQAQAYREIAVRWCQDEEIEYEE